MVIIKNVFFVDAEERLRAFDKYKGRGINYLGLIATYKSGDAISIYGKHNNNYIPTWILSAVCEYLEKTRNNNNDIIIHQDYDFYIYMYQNDCFIEVNTREEVDFPK